MITGGFLLYFLKQHFSQKDDSIWLEKEINPGNYSTIIRQDVCKVSYYLFVF